MDKEVFLSLLAMDAYNRGTGASIGSLQESGEIGRASIITRESIFGDRADAVLQSWQAAGFYAIAYDWNGAKIISYRRSNFAALSNVTDKTTNVRSRTAHSSRKRCTHRNLLPNAARLALEW